MVWQTAGTDSRCISEFFRQALQPGAVRYNVETGEVDYDDVARLETQTQNDRRRPRPIPDAWTGEVP